MTAAIRLMRWWCLVVTMGIPVEAFVPLNQGISSGSDLSERPQLEWRRWKQGTAMSMTPPDIFATTNAILEPGMPLLAVYPLAGSVASGASADAVDGGTTLSSPWIVGVFVIGLVPFAVATVEFWRRIAVGESFGTGSDSVVIIGEDDAPASSRGRRVLGKGALAVAYVLFAVAAAVVAITVASVVTSAPPPADFTSN